jgi:magnesium-transporting ATPase (P-type)
MIPGTEELKRRSFEVQKVYDKND